MFLFLLADCICMSIAFCLSSPWVRVSIFTKISKTVFKICLKINLVEFFILWNNFFTVEDSRVFSKHPVNSLFKLGWETGFHLNTFYMRIVCENTVKTASFNPVWRDFKVFVISNHCLLNLLQTCFNYAILTMLFMSCLRS